jgi:hypothetical protein
VRRLDWERGLPLILAPRPGEVPEAAVRTTRFLEWEWLSRRPGQALARAAWSRWAKALALESARHPESRVRASQDLVMPGLHCPESGQE